jgi:hypothetical protein
MDHRDFATACGRVVRIQYYDYYRDAKPTCQRCPEENIK